ncbi:hypothetical protein DYBT9275_05921 [Dyadobacter sp. CECT 9275]|uniref:PorV/PorQ family protein n=1 Tax=Dyadobacter helix TaxID=2822344 RepID=A0A916JHY4_9BACT|nr:hypothetical protein [Dyadobacter sp. CECT 9275]CAG5018084.1 hypothetical protein DYBT9275_05921 [Dyadobacter sp. CECT 9275]
MRNYPNTLLAFLFLFISLNLSAQQEKKRAVHAGLIYPLSTNGLQAGEYTNAFSVHAVAGYSKAETGTAIAGFGNVTKSSSGVLIAGFGNVVQDSAKGVQIAGFANVAKIRSSAFQVAGFANMARGDASGQVSGFCSVARGEVRGVQLSGFLNCAHEVNTQISGFINIAKRVKGVQLAGFINVADSSDYPIGLVNIIKTGEKSVALSIDETMTTMASFRSGGRVMYGVIGVGYNLKNTGKSLYGAEAGFGAHVRLASDVRLNLEMVSQTLSDFKGTDYFKSSIRVLPGYKFGKKLEVYAGPTFNYIDYGQNETTNLIKRYVWSRNKNNGDLQGLYFGVNAGIQILL